MDDFIGKTAIVTGAASGLGFAVAQQLITSGASVILTDINVDQGAVRAENLGKSALFLKHDVSISSQWDGVIEQAEQYFGPISILINNAGMAQAPTPLDQCSEEDFRRIFEVNQLSTFLGMRAVAPSMRKVGSGAIVNISSVAGLKGHPGAVAYVASKYAITGMTKVAALDFAKDNIRVNSVHPGLINTPMVRPEGASSGPDPIADFAATLPIPRAAEPDEIAQVVLFAASSAASFCTGAAFSADGGWTL